VLIFMVDGQGGDIGEDLIKRLKEFYQEEYEVVALGTNEVDRLITGKLKEFLKNV